MHPAGGRIPKHRAKFRELAANGGAQYRSLIPGPYREPVDRVGNRARIEPLKFPEVDGR